MVDKDINHMKDALQNPNIKYLDIWTGIEAWYPPNNKEPSITAWGFNQVTIKQVIIILTIESLTFTSFFTSEEERIKLIPM